MKVVWHRYDLRAFDHRSLDEAGEEAVPVYIFDPKWLKYLKAVSKNLHRFLEKPLV